MIPYYTTIDTVAFQINCSNDSYIQREILYDYKEYLQRTFNPYIDPVEYSTGYGITSIEHKIYCNNRTVLSIQTGYSNYNYYLKIIVAGCSTYDSEVDSTSKQYLDATVAYFNHNRLPDVLGELDIAIDVPYVGFEHLLAICTTKTSGTLYHSLQEPQLYENETHYVEKFESDAAKNAATKRAYFYNKTIKELRKHNHNIGCQLQRFEVKLQSNFFNRYGLDMAAIEQALNKYHFLYFENLNDKYNIIDRYSNYSVVTKREIQRMGLERYRLHFDMEYINDFLYGLQYLTFDDLPAHFSSSYCNHIQNRNLIY